LTVAKDDDDRAILRLLATGATNDAIAGQIFASEQSVKNRLSRMMKAAGVSNRTEFALLLTGTKLPPPPFRVDGRDSSGLVTAVA
jgi:DNA-binding NarL/FixJ family response regulator